MNVFSTLRSWPVAGQKKKHCLKEMPWLLTYEQLAYSSWLRKFLKACMNPSVIRVSCTMIYDTLMQGFTFLLVCHGAPILVELAGGHE